MGSPAELTSQGWTPVTIGESGATVLRSADGSVYAKFVAAEQSAVLEGERDRMEWASSYDIATARVLDWTADNHWACLVTSAVPGVSSDRLSSSQLWEAWPSITSAVRRLHEVPAENCPFNRGLSEMFGWTEHAITHGTINPQFLPAAFRQTPPAEVLQQLRDQRPRRAAEEDADLVVCHGDLCLPNVIVDPTTHNVTGFIDLGRLGRADRYGDIALLLGNSRGTWSDEEQAVAADRSFADGYGITLDPARQQFYLCLDALTWDTT